MYVLPALFITSSQLQQIETFWSDPCETKGVDFLQTFAQITRGLVWDNKDRRQQNIVSAAPLEGSEGRCFQHGGWDMEINLWHHQQEFFSRLKLINRARLMLQKFKKQFQQTPVYTLEGEQLVFTGLCADGLSLGPPQPFSPNSLEIDVSMSCEMTTTMCGVPEPARVWDLLNGPIVTT